MSWMKRLLIVPPVLAGVALIWWVVANREPPAQVPPQERVTVARVITAEPRSFTPKATGFGTVEPAHTWEAIAQVSGQATYVNPKFIRGGFVSRNEVLVRLAKEDYELQIAESRASIESAEADVQELELTKKTTGASLEIQKRTLELEQAELERQKTLLERGVGTQKAVETQQTDLLKQQVEVQALENELALIPAKMRALEQAKAKAEVNLETARLNLARTEIKAPFDARVSKSEVEIGQFVNTGTNMGSLDGIAAAEIDVQIPPSTMASFVALAFGGVEGPATAAAASRIESGLSMMKAEVKVNSAAIRAKWDAKVVRVSDTFDPDTRSVGIIVQVEDPYGSVRPGVRPPLVKGIFAQVDIIGPTVDNVIVLPRGAVREGRLKVVGKDNRLAFADIEVAGRFNDSVVLKGGLEPGTQVVVSDLSPAIEGMLLNPVLDKAVMERLAGAAADDGGKAVKGEVR